MFIASTAVAVTVPVWRCVASGAIQGLERLAFRVDADVRVVLKHPARQMAADRLEHVIGDAHLGEFRDHRMPQVVEPQAVQARAGRDSSSLPVTPDGHAWASAGRISSRQSRDSYNRPRHTVPSGR
jgi:hypothetical protein